MGESIAEGTIVRWLKQVGDAVERDEPLFEISTDKVDAEIPAPTSGVLVAVHAAAGAVAPVNSTVGVIESSIGSSGSTGSIGSGSTGSTGSTGSIGSTGSPAPFEPLEPFAPLEPFPSALRASPVARVIAFTHKIDLRTLTGTGGAGRVTKSDVLARLQPREPVESSERAPVAPRAPFAPLESRSVPMSVMRRKIAEHMIASRRTSAHVYSTFEVDCSRVEALRAARKAEYEAAGAKLSILPFVVGAAAAALREMPLLNASLDGDSIVYHGDVNVGIAVALDNGLIVPVIRRADALGLRELSLAIADLARRARAKQLKPEEVAGGTFTVTNPGNFGGAFATPIINQPQMAILELGTVEKRVVVRNDALAIRPMMNLTLGFDHRLIDGVMADRFLASIKSTLETWTDHKGTKARS
jgi:pyruvate dehydrogenase E2 component (dihydrolipoamide acetyltransferase)